MATAQILIVEDEDYLREVIRAWVQRLGYDAPAVAASGPAALAKAAEARPDLVLMDIRLPGGMDGVEAARRLRARLPAPVVYLTGCADEPTVERALATAPAAFVRKPFGAQALRSAIEAGLEASRRERRLWEAGEWLAGTVRRAGAAVLASDLGGAVAFMNTAAEDLTGWPLADARGRDVAAVFVPSGDEAGAPVSPSALLGQGRRIHSGPQTLASRDGTRRRVVVSASPIQDEADAVLGNALIFRKADGRDA